MALIEYDKKRDKIDALHNHIRELLGEAHLDKHLMEELPLNPIYALDMSSLRAINPCFPVVLRFIKWKHSKAMKVLLVIILLGAKALWVYPTMSRKMSFNILAKVFVIILNNTFIG